MATTTAPISATVTREGKKTTLVFDADLVEELGLEPGTAVKVTRQGKQLIIEAAPASSPIPTADREKFLRGVELSHERYADAYRKLAE